MASLMGEKVFEISGEAPSPSKDFFQLVITTNEVIWRTWKIPSRSDVRPKAQKECYYDFLLDQKLQEQIRMVFGMKILQYIIALCQGHYLECMPNEILLKILSYLRLKDVTQLGQTSHRFRKLCNSEVVWKQIIRNHCAGFTPETEFLAKVKDWRKTFSLFFYPNDSKKKQGGN